MTQEILKKMDERKEVKSWLNHAKTRMAKAKCQEEYGAKHLEVKRHVRRDKQVYIEELATKAETADQRNMKELCGIMQTLSGRKDSAEKPIKSREGPMLTTTEEQMGRWTEHFAELLNRLPPIERATISPADEILPISIEAPTQQEIKEAVLALQNNKAAGQDGIQAGALKVEVETTVSIHSSKGFG